MSMSSFCIAFPEFLIIQHKGNRHFLTYVLVLIKYPFLRKFSKYSPIQILFNFTYKSSTMTKYRRWVKQGKPISWGVILFRRPEYVIALVMYIVSKMGSTISQLQAVVSHHSDHKRKFAENIGQYTFLQETALIRN